MKTISSGNIGNVRPPAIAGLAEFMEDSDEQLLTVEDLANIFCVTTSAIHKRVQRGRLKSIKDGKRRYFLKSKVFGDLRASLA